jgi:hypothetical protein
MPAPSPIVSTPSPSSNSSPAGWLLTLFRTLGIVLVLARFYRFRPFLDDPHAFRQAWTSYYAQAFYQFGMNIFRPSIIAMGDYRHVLIEFAVPEWIVAVIYHITGPTLYVDRLVSITFFLGSAYFLFQVAALLRDRLLAWLVTLLYMAAPLGIYFSRAIHIDSAALCFGHAFVYYFLRYGESGRRRDLLLASTGAALGFLVKAPYIFFLILPVLYLQLARGERRRAVVTAVAFGTALGAGLAWYLYAQSVNRRAPDLSFVRGYETTADRLDFYMGASDQRLSVGAWRTIATRIRDEISARYFWILVPLAIAWPAGLGRTKGFALVWTAGSLVFLVMFFPVGVIHNYYQLPFVAPFALWAAMPLYGALTWEGRSARVAHTLAVAALVSFAGWSVWLTARSYYQVDREGMAVGDFVHARTDDRDLVIMAFNDAYFLDPRYLYYSGRRGWSIRAGWLEPRAIDGLRPHGATLVVTSDEWPVPDQTAQYLKKLPLAGSLAFGGHLFVLHRLE